MVDYDDRSSRNPPDDELFDRLVGPVESVCPSVTAESAFRALLAGRSRSVEGQLALFNLTMDPAAMEEFGRTVVMLMNELHHPQASSEVPMILNLVADNLTSLGFYSLGLQVLDCNRRFLEDHPNPDESVKVLERLAKIAGKEGRIEDHIKFLEQALEIQDSRFGGLPIVLPLLMRLASALTEVGRFDASEVYCQRIIDLLPISEGSNAYVEAVQVLAVVLMANGRSQEAFTYLDQEIAKSMESPSRLPACLTMRLTRLDMLSGLDRIEEAEKEARIVISAARGRYGLEVILEIAKQKLLRLRS